MAGCLRSRGATYVGGGDPWVGAGARWWLGEIRSWVPTRLWGRHTWVGAGSLVPVRAWKGKQARAGGHGSRLGGSGCAGLAVGPRGGSGGVCRRPRISPWRRGAGGWRVRGAGWGACRRERGRLAGARVGVGVRVTRNFRVE
jgi:hypothetical protein